MQIPHPAPWPMLCIGVLLARNGRRRPPAPPSPQGEKEQSLRQMGSNKIHAAFAAHPREFVFARHGAKPLRFVMMSAEKPTQIGLQNGAESMSGRVKLAILVVS